MKSFFGIGLLLLLVTAIWRDVVVYSIFKWQQEYISKNECVNRNVTKNSCHGNCVLAERLEQPQDSPEDPFSLPETQNVKLDFIGPEILDNVQCHSFERPEYSESIMSPFRGYTLLLGQPPEFYC